MSTGSGKTASVYPRVCGGTLNAVILTYLREGLSPRVRGNLIAVPLRTDDKRSIPACAGEPVNPGGHDKVVTVYPRVCGGTLTI